jgi:hypothetical protein
MTEASFPRRQLKALLGISALPFLAATALAADPTLTLSIRNDDAQSLRCMVVFAHWVTTDVGPIASGETATVSMTRGPQQGALHIARFDGRPMMIENIICGADKDWRSNSVEQLPLSPARDSATSAYQIACHTAPRVVCAPSPQSSEERDAHSGEAQ